MPDPRRVLCVEDDPDIRAILEFSLADIGGYQVRLCADGETAISEFAAFAPHLLMLDVMLPGLSGPQTLQRLREQQLLGQTPVVFLTAKALPHELEGLTQFQSTGIIVKPFDPMTLPEHLLLYLRDEHSATA